MPSIDRWLPAQCIYEYYFLRLRNQARHSPLCFMIIKRSASRRDIIVQTGKIRYLVNNAATPGTRAPIPPSDFLRMYEAAVYCECNSAVLGASQPPGHTAKVPIHAARRPSGHSTAGFDTLLEDAVRQAAFVANKHVPKLKSPASAPEPPVAFNTIIMCEGRAIGQSSLACR